MSTDCLGGLLDCWRRRRQPTRQQQAKRVKRREPKSSKDLLRTMRRHSQAADYAVAVEKLRSFGLDDGGRQLLELAKPCAAGGGRRAYRYRIRYAQSYAALHEQPGLCSAAPHVLVAVHSNAPNLRRRMAIRRTWGSLRYVGSRRVAVAFFLGTQPDAGVQAAIDEESRRHGDVVQLNFVENYRNMTIKHLAVYEWLLRHCRRAPFLAKVDDDTFVDVAHLVSFVDHSPPSGFYCSATRGAKPQRVRRGPKAKWTVTRREFPDKVYPAYCEGFGYVLNTSRCLGLHVCSLFRRFFWIDDVHATGVLAAGAGVPMQKFWRGHAYSPMLPSLASEGILDYIFLTAENSEFFESVWHRLCYSVLRYSLDVSA